jgi:hypothetical protein
MDSEVNKSNAWTCARKREVVRVLKSSSSEEEALRRTRV